MDSFNSILTIGESSSEEPNTIRKEGMLNPSGSSNINRMPGKGKKRYCASESRESRKLERGGKVKRTTVYVSRHFVPPMTTIAAKERKVTRHLKSANGLSRAKRKVNSDKHNIQSGSGNTDTTDPAPSDLPTQWSAPSSDQEIVKTELRPSKRRKESHSQKNVLVKSGIIEHSSNLVQYDGDTRQPEVKSRFAATSNPELKSEPRIYYGLNIDDLSSDSDLTDIPEDIGPDPFSNQGLENGKPELLVVKRKTSKPSPRKPKHPTKSPYFPNASTFNHSHRSTFISSTLPFPPLSHPNFGLMQERLAHDPFRLLLATIFLNKTPGSRAMPVFFRLMSAYPTPDALAKAEVGDVTAIIRELGFQNQRARKCVEMSKKWVESPPERGKRYRKLNYPNKGDGRGLKEGEWIADETSHEEAEDGVQASKNTNINAWEIAHLPGLGPYSHDSWRIFCRDNLRGFGMSWKDDWTIPSATNTGNNFEPEWKRVIPLDKELRAYLTWKWLKEKPGWVWNKETGIRTIASDELIALARGEGNVVIEGKNEGTLEVRPLIGHGAEQKQERPSSAKRESNHKENRPAGIAINDRKVIQVKASHGDVPVAVAVEQPAGEFLPPTQK